MNQNYLREIGGHCFICHTTYVEGEDHRCGGTPMTRDCCYKFMKGFEDKKDVKCDHCYCKTIFEDTSTTADIAHKECCNCGNKQAQLSF